MDGDPIEEAIIRNLVFIKKNITSFGTMVDVLVAKEIIGLHERSNFSSPGISNNDNIQEVINVVLKKGASDEFITALIDSGNEHVAEQILSLDETGFATYTQGMCTRVTGSSVRPRDRLLQAYRDIATLQREKNDISKEIKSLQTDHEDQVANLHEQIIKLKDQMREKDNSISMIKAQNEHLRKLNEIQEKKSTRHEEQMNEMNQTLAKVVRICETTQKNVIETQEKVIETQQKVTILEDQMKKPRVRGNLTSTMRAERNRVNKH